MLDDVIPFWPRDGLDGENGDVIASLDRDGTVMDTDKIVWFQGRASWMFATQSKSPSSRMVLAFLKRKSSVVATCAGRWAN